MGRLRYIGSKARLAAEILDQVGSATSGRFVDVFSGTGIVSREAALRGWRILANDNLLSATTITTAQLLSQSDVSFWSLGGYKKVISILNSCPRVEGFIFREYSPSGLSRSGNERLYFTCENAARIDGARLLIRRWSEDGLISEIETSLLLSDLMEAANRIANIAGTYGCFLSKLSPSANRALSIQPRVLLLKPTQFQVLCADAFSLKAEPGDVVYLDPPYTKRQYAAYYHLLETIAAGDSPDVKGVVGLRPWEAKASPFCYKRRALSALIQLATEIGGNRVLISYNSEGHIKIEQLTNALLDHGNVVLHDLAEIGRYRPNEKATANGESVTEFLVEFVPGPATNDVNVLPKCKKDLEFAL